MAHSTNRIASANIASKHKADEGAQKTIKGPAVADRVAKEATHAQTVEAGNEKKAAAANTRTSCQSNAKEPIQH